jgi:hypothetical protein
MRVMGVRSFQQVNCLIWIPAHSSLRHMVQTPVIASRVVGIEEPSGSGPDRLCIPIPGSEPECLGIRRTSPNRPGHSGAFRKCLRPTNLDQRARRRQCPYLSTHANNRPPCPDARMNLPVKPESQESSSAYSPVPLKQSQQSHKIVSSRRAQTGLHITPDWMSWEGPERSARLSQKTSQTLSSAGTLSKQVIQPMTTECRRRRLSITELSHPITRPHGGCLDRVRLQLLAQTSPEAENKCLADHKANHPAVHTSEDSRPDGLRG